MRWAAAVTAAAAAAKAAVAAASEQRCLVTALSVETRSEEQLKQILEGAFAWAALCISALRGEVAAFISHP